MNAVTWIAASASIMSMLVGASTMAYNVIRVRRDIVSHLHDQDQVLEKQNVALGIQGDSKS